MTIDEVVVDELIIAGAAAAARLDREYVVVFLVGCDRHFLY